jgi:hypothetical protein
MRRLTMTGLALTAASVFAFGLGLLGCSQAARGIRTVTYPHDFRYYETAEIDDSMKRLAAASRRLTSLLRDGVPRSAAERAEVVDLLGEMEEASATLDGRKKPSNHPVIDAHLERFQRDVSAARAAAERDPPNYFLAGTVAGSCMLCHGE